MAGVIGHVSPDGYGKMWAEVEKYVDEHPDITIGELSKKFNISKEALAIHYIRRDK